MAENSYAQLLDDYEDGIEVIEGETFDEYQKRMGGIDYNAYGGLTGMGYANGGGVGSMMQPKKVAIQGGVENYKPSKMVTAPRKAKSSPNHPSTELAYITQAEKDLLIKKDLHNSLKGKPNKGPSGLMSLNGGFNEPGGFQSGGNQSAAESGDKGAFGGGAENRARASAVRSAAINAGAGQKVNAGFFGGKYNDTVTQAEIAAAKAARNDPNNIFGAGAYDRTRGFGSTGLGGLMRGFNPLSLIAGLIGGPFAGLAMRGLTGIKGGFKSFNEKMRGINPLTGEANTQAEYEAMVNDRRTESRRDKLQAAKDKGYNTLFGMKTTDFTPFQEKTLANLNTQTGVKNNLIGGNATSSRFSNFEPRIGLQTQPNTTSFYENEMSIPTQPQGIAFNNPVGGLDQYAKEMEALEAARGGQKVSVNELGGTLQDFYTNTNPGTNANTRFEVIDDNINFNTQPQKMDMMTEYFNSIDNKATGPNIVQNASEIAQQAKTFNTTDALNNLGNTTEKGFFGTSLTDQGKGLESFRNSAVNFYNSPNNTNKTAQSALNFMSDRPGLYGDVIENKDFIQNAINQGFLQTEDDYKNQESLENFI